MKKSMPEFLLAAATLLAIVSCSHQSTGARNIKVWDGKYSAFPSIIEFDGWYYISFREAESHIFNSRGEADGAVQVVRSKDGESWEDVACLTKEGYDLRDPKLSITPDGRLMITIGGSIYKDKVLLGMVPQVSFSEDGKTFSVPEPVKFTQDELNDNMNWIWRLTWFEGAGYGVSYSHERFTLVKTTDGVNYDTVRHFDEITGFPGESTIRFTPDGTMYMIVRQEEGDKLGLWGKSVPPYNDWEWKKMNFHLGGPDFIILEDGTVIAGSRFKFASGANKTIVLKGNLEGAFEETFLVPSGGDTSYPGFITVGDECWMVYYSCHEHMGADHHTNYNASPEDRRRACIYLEKMPLELFRHLDPKGGISL